MEMMKMNKVKLFESADCIRLSCAINDFAKKHEIIDVSLATSKAGDTFYYSALVMYKAKD